MPCTPFENVKYLYPYRQQKDKLYANTALPVEDLAEQFNGGQAANFIYTFEHDISKVDMLFSIMTCDCIRMQQLLQKSNNETSDIMETFKAISTFEEQPEDSNEHYFEVRLFGVPQESGLLDEDDVIRYLSETAPIDFDSQQFPQARKIRDHFSEKGFPITCYKILRGARKKPIYKLYSRSLSTGKQGRTKTKDYVRDVEFIYKETSDGKPLYIVEDQ